jgi:hypothetical protein
MCRILGIESEAPVETDAWIRAFALRCRDSREYQGHGWGVAWWTGTQWHAHRSLTPIWDDAFAPPRSAAVLVHARSAFRNEGIELANNMPFVEGDVAFAFNGELRGVRLSAPGATGAARLLHLLMRFRHVAGGDALAGLERLDEVVTRRSEHVRALNTVVADGPRLAIGTRFDDAETEYFTLHAASVGAGRAVGSSGMRLISSERIRAYGVEPAWRPVPNRTTASLSALIARPHALGGGAPAAATSSAATRGVHARSESESRS